MPEHGFDIGGIMTGVDPALAALGDPKTAKNLNQLGRITTELQKTAMSLRVVPIGQTFQRMARVFRDLVRENGKLAVLETSGEDAELDRTIVEQLADPLLLMQEVRSSNQFKGQLIKIDFFLGINC